MEKMPRTVAGGWAWLAVAGGLLAGCAGNPSTLVTLQEARVTLDRARSAETIEAHHHILEAEGALSYAEQEYQLSPDHPLSVARAENALAKARAAYQATITGRRTRYSAH